HALLPGGADEADHGDGTARGARRGRLARLLPDAAAGAARAASDRAAAGAGVRPRAVPARPSRRVVGAPRLADRRRDGRPDRRLDRADGLAAGVVESDL